MGADGDELVQVFLRFLGIAIEGAAVFAPIGSLGILDIAPDLECRSRGLRSLLVAVQGDKDTPVTLMKTAMRFDPHWKTESRAMAKRPESLERLVMMSSAIPIEIAVLWALMGASP